MAFTLERAERGPRSPLGGLPLAAGTSTSGVSDGALARVGRRAAGRWWRQLAAGRARFREPDGNRLLRGADAVLSLPHLLDLLADELPGLRAGRFALSPVSTGDRAKRPARRPGSSTARRSSR